jgi:hypothetical protein
MGRKIITRGIIPGVAGAPGYGRPPLRGKEFELVFATCFRSPKGVGIEWHEDKRKPQMENELRRKIGILRLHIVIYRVDFDNEIALKPSRV